MSVKIGHWHNGSKYQCHLRRPVTSIRRTENQLRIGNGTNIRVVERRMFEVNDWVSCRGVLVDRIARSGANKPRCDCGVFGIFTDMREIGKVSGMT